MTTRSESDTILLNVYEVCRKIGCTRATIYKRVADGSFPKPVHIGPRSPRWRSDEIADWIDRLSEARAA